MNRKASVEAISKIVVNLALAWPYKGSQLTVLRCCDGQQHSCERNGRWQIWRSATGSDPATALLVVRDALSSSRGDNR